MIFTILQKMKFILWSIHTFWYKGLAKKRKMTSWKTNASILKKTIVRTEKWFFTKGSKNLWILHWYNVFRSTKSIQIQPINPNLINQRKIAKKIRMWFDISRISFYIYIYIYIYIALPICWGACSAGKGSNWHWVCCELAWSGSSARSATTGQLISIICRQCWIADRE